MNIDHAIDWRRYDAGKSSLYLFLSILTAGILPFYCFFFPDHSIFIRTVSCSPLDADVVKIKCTKSTGANSSRSFTTFVDVNHFKTKSEDLVSVETNCLRFVATSKNNFSVFESISSIPPDFVRFLGEGYMQNNSSKDIKAETDFLSFLYGKNKLTIASVTFYEIFLRQMLSPFYVFQYFAASVWFAIDYWTYATMILVITFGSVYITAREIQFNTESMRELAGAHNKINLVKPIDGGKTETVEIDDQELIPGQSIVITNDLVLPCDAILVKGKVVMDESMLTGESIPVSKNPIDLTGLEGNPACPPVLNDYKHASISAPNTPANLIQEDLSIKRSGNVLFAGTKVKMCYNSECVAVCYRTSFRSAKGQLVASLLTPKEGFINFVSDALVVLAFMFMLTTIIYGSIIYILVGMGSDASDIVLHYLDCVTVSVPPGLTACLTVSTSIAISKLKVFGIFVTDTTRVNFAGVIDAICFDKTGTLTENALHYLGCLAILENEEETKFLECKKKEHKKYKQIKKKKEEETGELQDEEIEEHVKMITTTANSTLYEYSKPTDPNYHLPLPYVLQLTMATCHSLTIDENHSTPQGDPLEVELFLTSEWKIKNIKKGRLEVTAPYAQATSPFTGSSAGSSTTFQILKHFEFTPDRLRALSIVQDASGNIVNLLKGSPEMILKLCKPDSIPESITTLLNDYARLGYRVIATASQVGHVSDAQCLTESGLVSSSQLNDSVSYISANNPGAFDLNNYLAYNQDQVESYSPFYFTGLFFLSSVLKPETCDTITALNKAHLHVTMITGDHIHTAVTVAAQCGIVDIDNKEQLNQIELELKDGQERNNKESTELTDKKKKRSSKKIQKKKLKKLLYIIDMHPTEQSIQIVNSQTDDIIEGHTLEYLISIAAKSELYNILQTSSMESLLNNSINDTSRTYNPLQQPVSPATSGSFTLPTFNSAPQYLTLTDTPSEYLEKLNLANLPYLLDLSITGPALSYLRLNYSKDFLIALIRYTKIFARMKPYDKKFLVETIMETPEIETYFLSEMYEGELEKNATLGLAEKLFNSKKSLGENKTVKYINYVKGLITGVLCFFSKEKTKAPVSSNSFSFNESSNENNSSLIDSVVGPSSVSTLTTNPDTMEVIFCGDGANDMLALRAATVGVSLCDTETSVAAPITSKNASPSSILHVIKEGKASLITAYVLIIFNIKYGIAQLIMACFLYYYGLIAGNYMYLVQDMFYGLFLGLAISQTKTSSDVSWQLPPKRFMINYFLVRLLFVGLSFVFFQLIAQYLLSIQSFYSLYETDDPLNDTYSYEASVSNNMSIGQILIGSITSTIGEPFRLHWTSNKYHLVCIVLHSTWLLYQIFTPYSNFAANILEIKSLPVSFGFIEVSLLVINLIVANISINFVDYLFLRHTQKRWYHFIIDIKTSTIVKRRKKIQH